MLDRLGCRGFTTLTAPALDLVGENDLPTLEEADADSPPKPTDNPAAVDGEPPSS